MNRKTQHGMALVTTLIFLSIVTFITVTFLGLTRRERQNVTVMADHNDAKLAAEAFMNRAQAQVIAEMLRTGNRFEYTLLMSQNDSSDTNGTIFSGFYQNVAYPNPASLTNLQFDPRPPVYVVTNAAGPLDFRYFMDFNRNGMYETNIAGEGGDPHWIGVLENPTLPHGPNNRFLARGLFVMVPAGKTLDLNTIHNQSKYNDPAWLAEAYNRNQGVGPWEINLGGLLTQLNTNVWAPSFYSTNSLANSDLAYRHALQLLNYRNLGYATNLSNYAQRFASAGSNAMRLNFVDDLANGPHWTGTSGLTNDDDNPLLPWFGSPVPNPFYDVQTLLNSNDVHHGGPGSFSERLRNVMQNNNTYDRWTYFRLLAQLGTDSGRPPAGKIHLNYDNQTPDGQTNFVSWHPTDFFRLTADRMLRQTFDRSLLTPSKLVQVYPLSEYSPAMHRVFQMAANIYDSSTNRTYAYPAGVTNYPYLPSVFRPWFTNSGTNLMILTYIEETNSAFTRVCNYMDADQAFAASTAPGTQLLTNALIYGVPVVIGARKGYPNFNEFATLSTVIMTRKMEVEKVGTNLPPVFLRTNQYMAFSITNAFYVEGWNSYTSAHPRPLLVYVTNSMASSLTDSNGIIIWPPNAISYSNNFAFFPNPTAIASWPGWVSAADTNSFGVWTAGTTFMTNHQYIAGGTLHFWQTGTMTNFEHNVGFPVPNWNLNLTNKVAYSLVDTNSDRVVDMVFMNDLVTRVNLAEALMNGQDGEYNQLFDTNRINNATSHLAPTVGHDRQMRISMGTVALANRPAGTAASAGLWTSYTTQPVNQQQQRNAIDTFRRFLGITPLFNPLTRYPMVTNMQTPFNPTVKLFLYHTWQANDPLVHYTTTDLTDNMNVANAKPYRTVPYGQGLPALVINVRRVNDRYQPWGVVAPAINADPAGAGVRFSEQRQYDWMYKDALIRGSDSWNFPTNPYPNLGWLGRVHRGTPWQTIYLKAAMPDTNDWNLWFGGTATNAAFSSPTNDWKLMDLFTTVVSENSSAGQLSINQTNEAAWAALLTGVHVLSNVSLTAPTYTNYWIEPATATFQTVYNGIHNTLLSLSNQVPPGVFTNLGQILSVPELTVGNRDPNNPLAVPPRYSPYIYIDPQTDTSSPVPQGYSEQSAISDDVYERIPQQILSLLKLEDAPRIVVYAFGQSLKPADRSIVLTPGPTRGLCTNYQVTGEVAIRSVMRIEGSFTDPANPPRVVIESYNVLQPTDF